MVASIKTVQNVRRFFSTLFVVAYFQCFIRYLLINPATSSAVVYLHLISHFHDFRLPFTFSKVYSDACIWINSRPKVTKSGFITGLLLFIVVAVYNNKNIENLLVRILILKILNWEKRQSMCFVPFSTILITVTSLSGF